MFANKNTDLEEQYDKIYRYCYFRVKNREQAEDITQETFLRFLESTDYQDTGKALRYLYTIARNLCIDSFRRQQSELVPVENVTELEMADSEMPYDRLVSQITMREALQELSMEERELLLLRYVNCVPVAVICTLLGISRFAVYRKTTGALRRLREKLGEEELL